MLRILSGLETIHEELTLDWIKSAAWEIKRSLALQGLGTAICLSHLATFLLWLNSDSVLFKESTNPLVCWSMFPRCSELQMLSTSQMAAFITSMAVVAGLGALSFLSRRGLGLAWGLLFSSFLGFSYVIFFDPNMITNFLTGIWFISFAFLLVPKRQLTFKLLFAMFFVFEALQKFNVDWLAGFWLTDHLSSKVSDKGIEWTALIVLLIQLIAPLGLFINTKIPVYFSSVALVALGFWWGSLGDWSHLAIASIGVLFFVLKRFEDKNSESNSMYQSYLHPEPSVVWAYVFLVLFLGVQLWHKATSGGKSPTHPFAMANYDIPQECNLIGLEKFKNGHRVFSQKTDVSKNQCDLNYIERFLIEKCTQLKADPMFIDISVQFYSRKVSQSEMKRLFSEDSYCKENGEGPKS